MLSLIETPLELVPMLRDVIRSGRSDSLTEYVRSTRVEPITLVEQGLVNLDLMPDLMQTNASIFIARYLMAVSISVNVGKVDTIQLLDKLNPNRDMGGNALRSAGGLIGRESREFSLPHYGSPESEVDLGLVDEIVAHEAKKRGEEDYPTSSKVDDRYAKDIVEDINLSVGKVVGVEINSDGHSATIPVNIRLQARRARQEQIVDILSTLGQNNTAKERYHRWRMGELEFIKDIILMNDIVSNHEKALDADETGIYKSIKNRRRNNGVSSLLSMGNFSVATASAIVVISKETAKKIERNIGGSLDSLKVRERFMKESTIMLLNIVDVDREEVVMYHKGIDEPTELTSRELKRSNKKSGPDISEILSAYRLGSTPVL